MLKKNFRGVAIPLPIVTELFLQSTVLVRPKGFPSMFKWPKSVNAFSSYVSAKKVSRSGILTLPLIDCWPMCNYFNVPIIAHFWVVQLCKFKWAPLRLEVCSCSTKLHLLEIPIRGKVSVRQVFTTTWRYEILHGQAVQAPTASDNS